MPILNASQYWKQGIVPKNTSGGLYYLSQEYTNVLPVVRSIFSSFDYHYWMLIRELGYDFNNSNIVQAGQWSPTSWMCDRNNVLAGKTCTSGNPQNAPDPWLVALSKFEVDHCLSQSTKQQCSLQYSFTILLVVIACDIAKIVAMTATLWMVSERPLTPLGDAIASFLERPDDATRGCCLMDQEQARHICHKSPWKFNSGHGPLAHTSTQIEPSLSVLGP